MSSSRDLRHAAAATVLGPSGNVVDYLLQAGLPAGNARANCTYLITPTRRWSFGEVGERVARAAGLLTALGVTPGQRVLFSVVDDIDFPALFLAIMKIGAVAIPVNTFLKEHDYRYFLEDSGAACAIVDHTIAPMLAGMRTQCEQLRHVVAAGAPVAGLPFLDDALSDCEPRTQTLHVDPHEMAFWLYSSGSTGRPKGVVHSGAHIYWATELFGKATLGISADDVVLSPPKMYFAFGLGNQVYFPLRTGAQVITNPGPITPETVWQQWLEHEPTIFMGVPTLYASMLRMAEDTIGRERVLRACRRLRLCLSGGEALPPSLLERWRNFAGIEILDGVGTTEMTHMFLLNRPGSPVPGSCGRLVAGYEAELLDESGNTVALGQIGNLHVRGPTAALSYWNNAAKSQEVMGRGGVMTGDKLYQDEHGNFFLAGRSDDMLRVGGIWVSPVEVEAVIASHPAVLECAVVGHPDQESMIKPRAFVVLRDYARVDAAVLTEELREHVRTRLAHFKCPRWFDFVTELPKTSTGKIQRFRLRQVAGE
jgi:benzoate-CoA ligase family protein